MNDKQRRFAAEYLVDLNATQAAIRAGYSAKTAKQQGQRLLTNVDVQRAVTAGQSARSERTQVNSDWVLQRLALEADADLADLYDAEGTLKKVHDWPLIWRQGLVAGVDVEELRVEGVVIGSVRKVKLSDRIKRVELIGKHIDVQAFKEKIEHTGGLTVVVDAKDAAL
ncbi:terminase [Novosphingobium barchaimii LL02]|uniref:Terminase n=1 Tax=Novosphingobium barchaimii LL02 TaxID=1114963 RepID=A0A0J8AY57_9SPHN|nr:terminase small subunit [Novosphingobium barchaimii]KMS59145.1 terminase [Novosphingobium barchaimii LL02]